MHIPIEQRIFSPRFAWSASFGPQHAFGTDMQCEIAEEIGHNQFYTCTWKTDDDQTYKLGWLKVAAFKFTHLSYSHPAKCHRLSLPLHMIGARDGTAGTRHMTTWGWIMIYLHTSI